MLLITLFIVLAIAVEGDRKIVHVSKLITDNSLSNGEGDNTCCVHGNCSCNINSLDIALASLTSNVLINITTDVKLSSLIKVSNIENIAITGYNNPSVNCADIGGLHFAFCHNLMFNGITLGGYGITLNYYTGPGLNLSYLSNIMIHFQHSVGPVVIVLLMSKNVTINSCRFSNNEGACIHEMNQNVYFIGKILLANNKARDDTGEIYIRNHSTVIFNKKGYS